MRKRLFARIMLATLLFSLLCALICTAVSAEAGYNDNSRPGSHSAVTVTSADLVERLTGVPLCEAERQYLIARGGYGFIFDGGITTREVTVTYEGETLDVFAKPYSYTAVSGSLITWLPVRAILGERENSLQLISDGSYHTRFDAVTETDPSATVKVVYSVSFSVSEAALSELLNKAYTDAPLLAEDISAAEREYAEAEQGYLDYLAEAEKYGNDLEAYKSYLAEYKLYSAALKDYEDHLAALAEYEIKLRAYNEYLAATEKYRQDYDVYAKYLSEYKTYLSDREEYDNYIADVTVRRAGLAALDLADITMTDLKRSARAAINGSMVDSVLAERDSLESAIVGAPPKVIDLAGNSTERLRTLMADYFALTTEAAKYAYYAEYYTEFRDNFTDLFVALDYLYTNSSVRAYIYEVDREEKYRILLAQLYLISECLTDGELRSVDPLLVAGSANADRYKRFTYSRASYKTADGYRLNEILGDVSVYPDTDHASPLEGAFPIEITEPIAPEAVEEPKMPAYVAHPEEVEAVEHPGDPPAEVADPGIPPAEVTEPVPPEPIPPEISALILAYENGELSYRDPSLVSGDMFYELLHTVSKKFVVEDEVTVRFYSGIGGSLLYEITVDRGTAAAFVGDLPAKPEDREATYSFAAWCTEEGEVIDLSSLEGSVFLYPSFKKLPKTYTVDWIVEGERTSEEYFYGDTPSFKAKPSKKETNIYKYSFIGWNKPVVAVDCDAEYIALFEEEYLAPVDGGGAILEKTEESVTLDYSAYISPTYGILAAIERAEGRSLTLVTPSFRISFSPREVEALQKMGAQILKLETEEALGGLSYLLSLLDGEGNTLEPAVRPTVDIPCGFAPSERLRLFYRDGEVARRYVSYSLEGGRLSFRPLPSRRYTLASEYHLVAASPDLITLTVDGSVFSEGESVGVNAVIPEGVRLVRLYYRDTEGNETDLDRTRFLMPRADITLIAEAAPIRYRITFFSEGRVLSSAYCNHGSMPAVPEDPKRADDGEFSYVFIGWDSEVTAAYSPAAYTAVFEKRPIEASDEVGTLSMLQSLTIGAAILLTALIGLAIGGIVARARRGGYY